MTIVLVCGGKGAPGATTTALVLAGCIPWAMLVDADLDGGSMAVRFGLARQPGLTTLASNRSDVADHVQHLGDVPVLVGPDRSAVATNLWARAGDRLLDRLSAPGRPLIVDGGRVREGSPSPELLARSDLTVMVVRSDDEGLVSAANLPPEAAISLVVIETGQHTAAEVGEASGRSVLGVLPFDRRSARLLNGEAVSWRRRGIEQSVLGRAGQTVARQVQARLASREDVSG